MTQSALPFALDALIFDFDGVLAESVSEKGEAFVDVYADHPSAVREAVLAYHEAHGGVSRYDKLRHYEENLLGRPVDAERLEALASRFSNLVEDRVVAAPAPAGADEFLAAYGDRLPLFIVSATPEEELKRIVRRRGSAAHFREILGTPQNKTDHIRNILARHGWAPDRVVLVGDSPTDYRAARDTGVLFVGRAPDPAASAFPRDIHVIPDLTGLEAALTGLAPVGGAAPE